MKTLNEIIQALIPDTAENLLLQIQRQRPTKHPGSKRHYDHRRETARRKMAAASNRINRRRLSRNWKH